MKIVLVGNFAPDAQESMLRFERLLRDGLAGRGHEVTVLSPQPCFARLARPYRYGGVQKYLGYLDKFLVFPRELRRQVLRLAPDVVHIVDHANAGYGASCGGTPVLATCHDVLQIQAARGEISRQQVGRMGRRYQAWILGHIARLPKVACVSRTTAEHVLRLTGLPPKSVSVVPNALNYPYAPLPRDVAWQRVRARWRDAPEKLARLSPGAGGFFLNVGGGQWYKNRPGLLTLFAELRCQLQPPPVLVMVGKPLSAVDTAQAQALGLAGDISSCQDVPNEDLQALYNTAEGLLFPSWQEGFGWPIAEAQACGCPVFTSDRAPMNEVGGESALYFDPGEPEAAAQKIIAGWSTRADRAQIGLQEAKRWAPEVMLEAYEGLYRDLVASQPERGS